MNNLKRKRFSLTPALPSLISILIGLLAGIIVILIADSSKALLAVRNLLLGPLYGIYNPNQSSLTGIGNMLFFMIPLLMTGLSVGFAFKTGLFNIGASGQFLAGSYVAILLARKLTGIPNSWRWLIALFGAALAGMLLAGIAGILKAFRNVNEVITSIMLNYISMYLVNYLIRATGLYDPLKNRTLPVQTEIPKFGLDKLFPKSFVSGGILIAIAIAIICYVLLYKTTFGFELRAVGLNRHASRYAGINEKRSIIMSMALAGLFAGMAGGMIHLAGVGRAIQVRDVLPPEGFDGIAVALLGLNHPLGIIFASLFMAYLKVGGQTIQTLGFAPEIINMMIGIILYVSAMAVLIRKLLSIRAKKRSETKTLDNSTGEPYAAYDPPDPGATAAAEKLPSESEHINNMATSVVQEEIKENNHG